MSTGQESPQPGPDPKYDRIEPINVEPGDSATIDNVSEGNFSATQIFREINYGKCRLSIVTYHQFFVEKCAKVCKFL